jgi:hypothetical protein
LSLAASDRSHIRKQIRLRAAVQKKLLVIGASNAEDLKPIVAGAGDNWRNIFLRISSRGEQMGEVVQFIPKRDLDRARLIQEARAIYEGIFPTEKGPVSLQRGPKE